MFTILIIYNNKQYNKKERYKNHTDMHKYTFTINITCYRAHKDSQHSDNSLSYSQTLLC
jgi:hypothetical protein